MWLRLRLRLRLQALQRRLEEHVLTTAFGDQDMCNAPKSSILSSQYTVLFILYTACIKGGPKCQSGAFIIIWRKSQDRIVLYSIVMQRRVVQRTGSWDASIVRNFCLRGLFVQGRCMQVRIVQILQTRECFIPKWHSYSYLYLYQKVGRQFPDVRRDSILFFQN
jgi:hypothetical protein